ncbi:hypothetical protein AM228_15880 [Planktothricoides sp. SR001]|nr:hypothetical protein AM228_15880 [Planktothricoides sp. SR001]
MSLNQKKSKADLGRSIEAKANLQWTRYTETQLSNKILKKLHSVSLIKLKYTQKRGGTFARKFRQRRKRTIEASFDNSAFSTFRLNADVLMLGLEPLS